MRETVEGRDEGRASMRAALVQRHGGPDGIEIATIASPVPSPTQVRVRVVASGVQPFDTYVRQGLDGFRLDLPHQLGNEFSGVIDEVGENVHEWHVGDQVLGSAPLASQADYVLAEPEAIEAKPPGMAWDEAGALAASGHTACTVLADLRVGAGDTVLVHGAAGGAGSMVVQLARQRGARVIGTASPANHDYLRRLGATPVEYGPGTVDRVGAVAPEGVDVALDAVGGPALLDAVALVADRRRVGTLVDHDRADEFGVIGIRARRSRQHLRQLTTAVRQGALSVLVRATLPLEQIGEAHRLVESGHGRGKVVIRVSA